ncbi:quinone oxidoreductase [Favolaschia claudopus]|uniref:Quinone oxidoreductase n=1 Tax=Favolaschia claudopus TaxID=2862362 RepID=A0AAW0BZT6_9AGAR
MTTSSFSAWMAVKQGDPAQVLQLKTDLQTPKKLPKGHVLVKAHAVALNPADYKLMRTLPSFIARRPCVIGMELSGVIVDSNGTEFNVGDKVFGTNAFPSGGTLAQYAVIPASRLAIRPPNLSAVEAAGLSIVTLTAQQSLANNLHIEPGQTVFVNGGSCSVGIAAIQICKSMGCKVVATASAKNKDFLLGLGVDEFLDYTEAPLVEQLLAKPPSPKYHGLFDAAGLTDPALYLNCEAYLAPGGAYLWGGTMPHSRKEWTELLRQIFEGFLRPRWLGGVARKYTTPSLNFDKTHIEIVRDLAEKGAVKPVIDSVFSFDDVKQAFEKLMTKHAKGKVVVQISEDE